MISMSKKGFFLQDVFSDIRMSFFIFLLNFHKKITIKINYV